MFKKQLSSRGKDYGITLLCKCSNCNSQGISFKEYSGKSIGDIFVDILLNFWGKSRSAYYFECPNCHMVWDIPDNEVEEVHRLNSLAKNLNNGSVSENEYLHAFKNSGSKTVKQIYDRSNTWICAQCNSEVPATFEVCWSCGSDCPDPECLTETEGEVKINTSCVFGSRYTNNDDPSKHIL